jgi:hypothetical protein
MEWSGGERSDPSPSPLDMLLLGLAPMLERARQNMQTASIHKIRNAKISNSKISYSKISNSKISNSKISNPTTSVTKSAKGTASGR